MVGELICVCLFDTASDDVSVLEETMRPRLAFYRLADTKIAHETEIIEASSHGVAPTKNGSPAAVSSTKPMT